MAENVGAAHLTVTGADPALISEILSEGGFGSRYPEGMSPDWK